jgi:cyclopropane fatty-acyl-phospholipid synthase-like methyltransferase
MNHCYSTENADSSIPEERMETSDDALTHYDRITSVWQFILGEDFHYGLFLRNEDTLEDATRNLTLLMADKCSLEPNLTVLDVGCGIGAPACFLAEHYRCEVTGISTSQIGVQTSRRLARARGCSERVQFVEADAMDNKLPTASFDRIWILESSHLMTCKDRMMAEAARVLRPGGRLVLCDVIALRKLSFGEVLARAKQFDRLHHAFGPAKMETLHVYQDMAREVGLRTVETMDLSNNTHRTFAHWQHNLDVHMDRVGRHLGLDDIEHFRISCEILSELWMQKILGYGLLAAVKDE